MHIYIRLYLYTHTYTCVDSFLYGLVIGLRSCLFMAPCAHVHMQTYTHTCIHTGAYVMYVFVLCLLLFLHMYIYIFILIAVVVVLFICVYIYILLFMYLLPPPPLRYADHFHDFPTKTYGASPETAPQKAQRKGRCCMQTRHIVKNIKNPKDPGPSKEVQLQW